MLSPSALTTYELGFGTLVIDDAVPVATKVPFPAPYGGAMLVYGDEAGDGDAIATGTTVMIEGATMAEMVVV